MFQRKMKTILISGAAVLSLVAGLLYPLPMAEAKNETTVDEENDELNVELSDQLNDELKDDSTSDAKDDTISTAKDSTDVAANDTSMDDGTKTPLGKLVAYWPFDGNYNETANNITTKLGGKQLTYIDGVFGKAAVFNGKDMYLTASNKILNLGNSRYDNNDCFSISAWINLGDSPDKDKCLLDKGTSIGYYKNDNCFWHDPYQIWFSNCEPVVNLSNEFENDNEDPPYVTEGESRTAWKHVEGQEWFLLTVTYDGKCVKIYHDNELLTQSNYTNGITYNLDDLFIGVDGQLESFFKGAVDDLRIYTKTLSYDDVNDLYEAGVKANKELIEPTKQLVAFYPFDDNLKDMSKFKNDAEKVAVGGTTKYVIGKNGKAITMSKGNYIRIPAGDQLNPETEFTVSFWLALNKAGQYPILYRQNPSASSNDDNDYTYQAYIDSWNKGENSNVIINTKVYDSSQGMPAEGQGLTSEINYADTKLKSTNWIHYTYTYKDGQMKFYLNGKLQNKSDKSDLINISNASGDLLIGYNGDTFIDGAIDELKIYTNCLSATEVEKEAKRIDSISLSSSDTDKLAAVEIEKTVAITSVILLDGDTGKESEIKPTDKNLIYRTTNDKVFKVSADGTITGVRDGNAKLIVKYGAHLVVCDVVVK